MDHDHQATTGGDGQALGLQIAEELAKLGEPGPERISWRHAELAAQIRDAGHDAEFEAGS